MMDGALLCCSGIVYGRKPGERERERERERECVCVSEVEVKKWSWLFYHDQRPSQWPPLVSSAVTDTLLMATSK